MLSNFNELDHEYFMGEALKEAENAGKRGDRAIGTVIVHHNEIIARGSNKIESYDNNLLHAEIDAMNKCGSYLRKHARECVIYTTVEPCIMCLSSIVMGNIRSVVYAREDKYMNMKPFIQSNPYIEKRVHHYLGEYWKKILLIY
ncbi:nucleoside deaminase [Ornithinibacillus halotolerans]|uniref:tRNA-specific adenosine deaminase n=1 Tax=Ornithinibacillus halotolerans TaxID=1274357 RepID=A0A916S507_9BACI|nr:nucleoside deaminase [Ornithinibacillus halotolerans]GGA84773.1 tRNA-specific adenosine deaminase [Ornithinibacillus halotolerans]